MGKRVSRTGSMNGIFLSLPIFLVLAAFFVWPIWNLLLLSFYDPQAAVGQRLTLSFYWKFLGDDYYRAILWRTLGVSWTVSFLALLLGYPVAYYIASQSSDRMRATLVFCVVAPMMISIVVRSYGW